ncbi:MAG: chromosome segregation protein SMC [Candidatus Omnitrophota bacterium]
MKLKKIELFGFKSFADKTELNFEGGVTAVVGPNGVGKSNISDAIKWVLGEQNARELRGLRMEDIIFNGTEARPPLNFAEVSLTFQNHNKVLPVDYNEVTITRRVFRTGESQYLLNKTAVRLKDINSLLMGTGAGVDSYSIIGQGKMDLVLSSKPEDRRYIFEEAAGITKYESQKREALRKLEQTRDNLVRLTDIIKEVSRQISFIERQVKKADKYKQKFEELKEKEIKVVFCLVEKLKEKLDSYSEGNHRLKEKEGLLSDEIEKMNSLLREARQKLAEVDEKLNKLYSKKVDLFSQIENANKHVSFNVERIEEITKRKENLEQQVQVTEIKVKELSAQISKTAREFNDLKEDKSNKNREAVQKEQWFKEINEEINEAEENIKKSKERIFEVTTTESRNKNELVKITADLSNINSRLRRLKSDKEEVEKEFYESEEQTANFSVKKEEINNRVHSLREQKEGFIRNIEDKRRSFEEIKTKINQLNQSSIVLNSRLEYLKSLKAKFEGYQSGVKSILMAKEQKILPPEGIINSIANLIKVEKGYEKAVEAALGKNVQVVVLRNRDILEKCIDYLKSESKGDASFICLEEIMSEDLNSSFENNLELKSLTQVVNCDEEFKKAVNFLVKDVYVSEDLKTAFDCMAKSDSAGIKVVTKEGDRIEKNLVTCRTHELEETSLIGRETRIKSLEEEIVEYSRKIAGLDKVREERLDEIKNLEESFKKLETELQKEEINLSNLFLSLKSTEEEKQRSREELDLLKKEMEEIETEEANLKQKRQEIEQQVEEINRNSCQMHTVMAASENSIKSRKEEREKLLITIARLKAELSSITDLEINQNQTIKMLESNSEEQKALLNNQRQEIEDSKVRIEKLRLEIDKVKQNTETLEEEHKLVSNELEGMSALKAEEVKNTREVESFVFNKQREIEEIRNNARDFQVKITELNFQLQSSKEHLTGTYKVNIDEVSLEIEEDFNYEEAKSEVDVLREKIDSLGAVNLVAIEENKELQDRFEFLNKQKLDLEEAKDSLQKAVGKINRTTKDLFLETFMNIREAFKEFYQLLFSGGEAELALLDETDVLSSGIEIAVRPPGKKMQNISLLSGGEKALTAIALLFAVFKVKPSPFCILDEIDAPLDESNIDRFTKVLREFLKTSHFIIITHNKKTISMADILYGVTMEEAGVSKLVSVKLKETEVAEEPKDEVIDSEHAATPI